MSDWKRVYRYKVIGEKCSRSPSRTNNCYIFTIDNLIIQEYKQIKL